MTLIEIINALKATSSRNDKTAILEENKEVKGLQEILFAASSPFFTTYHTKLPEKSPFDEGSEEQEKVNEALERLNTQEEDFTFDELLGGVFGYLASQPHIERSEIAANLFLMKEALVNDPEYTQLANDILKGDLSIGVSTSTINKVYPGLISTFDVMKAEEKAHLDNIRPPCQADLKLDGQAAFAFVDRNHEVIIRTSSGREYAKLPTIKKDVQALAKKADMQNFIDGFILCAELVAHDKDGNRLPRQISNGMASKARTGSISDEDEASMRLYVYDLLGNVTQLDRGIDARPLEKRMEHMPLKEPNSTIVPCPSVIVNTLEELHDEFQRRLDQGEEGIIAKNLDSIYENIRSKDWIKIKAELQAEVRIIDWTVHKKKPNQLGSMTIASEDGKIVGKIGTKLSKNQREELFIMAMEGKLVNKIMTAVFHEVTYSKTKKIHSFYLPRYIEIREDKDEADGFDKIMSM